jgi:hypothetical protein
MKLINTIAAINTSAQANKLNLLLVISAKARVILKLFVVSQDTKK